MENYNPSGMPNKNEYFYNSDNILLDIFFSTKKRFLLFSIIVFGPSILSIIVYQFELWKLGMPTSSLADLTRLDSIITLLWVLLFLCRWVLIIALTVKSLAKQPKYPLFVKVLFCLIFWLLGFGLDASINGRSPSIKPELDARSFKANKKETYAQVVYSTYLKDTSFGTRDSRYLAVDDSVKANSIALIVHLLDSNYKNKFLDGDNITEIKVNDNVLQCYLPFKDDEDVKFYSSRPILLHRSFPQLDFKRCLPFYVYEFKGTFSNNKQITNLPKIGQYVRIYYDNKYGQFIELAIDSSHSTIPVWDRMPN